MSAHLRIDPHHHATKVAFAVFVARLEALLATVERAADARDAERAHAAEDDLRAAVLGAIVEGIPDGDFLRPISHTQIVECARIARSTTRFDFSRWTP